MNRYLVFTAWKKLLLAYAISLLSSFAAGSLLVYGVGISADTVFQLSTKRISYAMPVIDAGIQAGIDDGLLIFFWNALGALVTISFIYTSALLNPAAQHRPPRAIRKLFCGQSRMRLLCFLPGCSPIESESIRRLYVWLMVPILSLILLGIESGLSLAAAKPIFGSYWAGVLGMLPHGIVEIPTFSLAGAVTYSAHLLVRKVAHTQSADAIFEQLQAYRDHLPIRNITLLVVSALLIAGWVEAHITQFIIEAADSVE